uniref:Transmembrane protein 238-like n=1 Tax=Geotrypetes seraphini TaxID=260995 RepID=A0A6P8Q1C7_GEOSA|nr:transmembrane protein 238-like [Geotrypetes seraphini]
MAFAHARLGRCSSCFWLAVAFDIFGLVVLLTGVFANVFFYDFLIYVGAIVIFLSLIWWVFWYTGNIEVPPEELQDNEGLSTKEAGGVLGLVRRLSRRISCSLQNTNSSLGYDGFAGTSRKRSAALSMASASQLKTVSASLEKEQRGESPLQVTLTSTI